MVEAEIKCLEAELEPAELEFCNEYVNNGKKGVKAAQKAYPDITYESAKDKAAKLTKTYKINRYIEHLTEKRKEEIKHEAIADRNEIMEFFTDTLRNEEVGIKDRIKAAEDMAKIYGMFVEKQEIAMQAKIDNPVKNLSTEEIREYLNARRK